MLRPGRPAALCERRIDSDLAVVGLAQAPVVLACHAHRLVAFLTVPAFVDEQHRIGFSAQVLIRPLAHPLPHASSLPRAVAQKILQILVLGLGNGFPHALHVFPRQLAQQSLEIVLSVGTHVPGLGAEKMGDHRTELGQSSSGGDNNAVFIFLLAALGRPFRRARLVRFLALAFAVQNLAAPANFSKTNLPK